MQKRLNEATVNISISDLSSSNLSALSKMLELASTAENDSDLGMGMGGLDSSMELMPQDTEMGSLDPISIPGEVHDVEIDPMMDSGLDAVGADDGLGIEDDATIDYGDQMFESLNRIYELAGLKSSNQLTESTIKSLRTIKESWGNALTGAEIGTAVEPGIGTVVGAGIGACVGNDEDQEVDEDYVGYDFTEDDFGPEADLEIPYGEECEFDSIPDFEIPENEVEEEIPDYMVLMRHEPQSSSYTVPGYREIAEALYNLELDEDDANEMATPGIGDNRIFGPYVNKLEAVVDARKECPGGLENVDFTLHNKPDGIYWKKTNAVHEGEESDDEVLDEEIEQEDESIDEAQENDDESEELDEDANFRPDQQDICPQSFRGDKSANQQKSMQKDGDNGLDDQLDESVEDIKNMISTKWSAFMKS
jgi:hypothetical protein